MLGESNANIVIAIVYSGISLVPVCNPRPTSPAWHGRVKFHQIVSSLDSQKAIERIRTGVIDIFNIRYRTLMMYRPNYKCELLFKCE